MKKIKEVNNYFIKKIDQNELMSNKNKKVCMTLNYIEHSLTVDFVVTGCISICDFSSLVDIYTRIISSTIGLNICAIIAKFKKLIIKKKQTEA